MGTNNSLFDDLVDAVEADIDSGDSMQEVDRASLTELRAPARAAAISPVNVNTEPEPCGETLDALSAEIGGCVKCTLHKTRTNVVPGQGNPSPEIMFIGEAPGADEDAQGQAFVGRAGKLLTKMIEAMGYTREEVFIGNILKCRPPENRPPMPDETEMCMPYLLRQIKVLKPKVIVALGGTAVKSLLKTDVGITKLRGQWHEFEGVPFMPTLHPAYLLRNPKAKHDVWADLKAVLSKLGKPVPTVKD